MLRSSGSLQDITRQRSFMALGASSHAEFSDKYDAGPAMTGRIKLGGRFTAKPSRVYPSLGQICICRGGRRVLNGQTREVY